MLRVALDSNVGGSKLDALLHRGVNMTWNIANQRKLKPTEGVNVKQHSPQINGNSMQPSPNNDEIKLKSIQAVVPANPSLYMESVNIDFDGHQRTL